MAVSSPCIGSCMIDRSQDWCVGCFRTRDEIALWTQMGEREKAGVVALCKHRKTQKARLTLAEEGREQ